MADLSLISDAAWREAQRRAEVIRPLAELMRRPRHLVPVAATRRCLRIFRPVQSYLDALLGEMLDIKTYSDGKAGELGGPGTGGGRSVW